MASLTVSTSLFPTWVTAKSPALQPFPDDRAALPPKVHVRYRNTGSYIIIVIMNRKIFAIIFYHRRAVDPCMHKGKISNFSIVRIFNRERRKIAFRKVAEENVELSIHRRVGQVDEYGRWCNPLVWIRYGRFIMVCQGSRFRLNRNKGSIIVRILWGYDMLGHRTDKLPCFQSIVQPVYLLAIVILNRQ